MMTTTTTTTTTIVNVTVVVHFAKNLTAVSQYAMINTRMDRRHTKGRITEFKLKHKLDKQNVLSIQITKRKSEN